MAILIYNNFQELYTTFLCNYIQEGAKNILLDMRN